MIGFTDRNTLFRTEKTIQDGRKRFQQAVNKTVSTGGLTPLQYSKGFKNGKEAVPYPGASRIRYPLLHVDLGVTTQIKKIDEDKLKQLYDTSSLESELKSVDSQINDMKCKMNDFNYQRNGWHYYYRNYSQTHHEHKFSHIELKNMIDNMDTNYKVMYDKYVKLKRLKNDLQKQITETDFTMYSTYTEKIKHLRILNNRYFDSLQGNQCKKYRKNWNKIMSHLSTIKYCKNMKLFVQYLNELFSIIAQSKPLVTEQECALANQLLIKIEKQWKKVKSECHIHMNMPPKFHYFDHLVKHMNLFKYPPGWNDEQGLEDSNQLLNNITACYANQLGIQRVKYAMRKVMIITSPKYYKQYTGSVDNSE